MRGAVGGAGGGAAPLPPSPIVAFDGVTFAYPGERRSAERAFHLTGVTFDLTPGEILGVIGPNSAGKTTLIRLLTRIVRPTGGEVRLAGRPLGELRRWEIAQRVAVVPQELPGASPFTAAEIVLMGRYPHGSGRFFEDARDREQCLEALAMTGTLHLAGLPLARLSGGERQRVALARALAQEPEVMVLDEPTAHLDLRYQAGTVALLRRLRERSGLTVLLVSHDLNLAAEVSDRLILLDRGRIEEMGPPDSVLDESVLARVYGCPVVVDKHPVTGRPAVHIVWPAR